jgi:hypothetical protein
MPTSFRRLVVATLAAASSLAALARTDEGPSRVDPATREMAALLAEHAARVDPIRLTFVINDKRAEIIGGRLAVPRPSSERLPMRFLYATELLNAGRFRDAISELDGLAEDARTSEPQRWPRFYPAVTIQKAMAYLRMAEEENCHQSNTADSCLLPIRGGGVHVRREGSTRAIEVLDEVLSVQPDELRARWLLNVAHMTLGSYPDGVKRSQLIPPSAFTAHHPLPRFDNVARDAGLEIYARAGGAVVDDMDNDGRLDVVVSALGFEDQLRYFWNRGDGRFEERTAAAGLTGVVGGLNIVHADYDNDGFVDILVLRGGWFGTEGRFPLSLLRNKGDGTFADVTKATGLIKHLAPTQTAAWLDYDGDGRLDLFVGNETSSGHAAEISFPCELFHANPDGTFTDVAAESGVAVVAFVKGVASGDFDNDGRPDLYLSTKSGDNLLLRNEGPSRGSSTPGAWRFRDAARDAGVAAPRNSFGTFFFDYDNDGWQDIFVAGYQLSSTGTMAADTAADYLGLPTEAERGRLYRNRGDGTFEDLTLASGLYRVLPAMGLNFGDLDNDGWLDIYLGTGDPDMSSLVPNRMFRNAGGRYFQDVTTAGNFGHLQKGHGVAFADVDNDGDQDVFEEMGGAYFTDQAYSVLFENPGNPNGWLGLELEGVRSNRAAYGARVKVELDTKDGPRTLHRTVGPGGSFGAGPRRLEIGLADARRIASVEISWPATGETQVLRGLQPNKRYRVREGVEGATLVERARFRIPRSPDRSASGAARVASP